jgi:uncharacterized membrane protein
MRSATEIDWERGPAILPELGVDAFSSPSPAVRGTTQGHVAWTGSERGKDLARSLGWFSIGLGLAEVVAPRGLGKLIGMKPTRQGMNVLRLMGLREIGAGPGMIANPTSRGWVAARVIGDTLDLALLAGLLAAGSKNRYKTLSALLAVLGVATLDLVATELLAEARKAPTPELEPDLKYTPVHNSITIEAPIAQVYSFWRGLTNLPSFMRHLESVENLGNGRSRWRAMGPAGAGAEWVAEIVEEVENTRIAWRATGNARPYNSGVVHFQNAPGGRGTVISVEVLYAPPGGKLGATALKLLRKEPGQEIAESLRALKQIIETGEILLSDATAVPGPHPARPPSPKELGH